MDASDFVGNFQLAQKLHLETLSQMRALEVSKIQVSYFGFNGDTEFDPVEMYDRDKNLLLGDYLESLKEDFLDLCSETLDCVVPLFNETQSGGQGDLIIKAKSGSLTIEHHNFALISFRPVFRSFNMSNGENPQFFEDSMRLHLPELRDAGIQFVAMSFDGANNTRDESGACFYRGNFKRLREMARNGKLEPPLEVVSEKGSAQGTDQIRCEFDFLFHLILQVLAPGYEEGHGSKGFLIFDVAKETLHFEQSHYSLEGTSQVIRYCEPKMLSFPS